MPRPRLPRGNCEACQKPLNNPRSRFCNNVCQGQARYQAIVKKWQSGETEGLTGQGELSVCIKRFLMEKHGSQCVECGWNTPHPTTGKPPLQVHHVDGNADNCKEENLRLLCPNCHSLTPTWGMHNRGNGRKRRRNGAVIQRENTTVAL